MSTRAQIRFATRQDGVSFSEHPDKIHAQFYCHHDGYPEGLGLDIANSLVSQHAVMHHEIEELQTLHGDLAYIYYVWQAYDKETWISIFQTGIPNYCDTCDQMLDNHDDRCIFVGKPEALIEKYKPNTDD